MHNMNWLILFLQAMSLLLQLLCLHMVTKHSIFYTSSLLAGKILFFKILQDFLLATLAKIYLLIVLIKHIAYNLLFEI